MRMLASYIFGILFALFVANEAADYANGLMHRANAVMRLAK